jgi:Fe-S-cluster containining protein
MSQPALTTRETLWLTCKQKSCCYASLVVVTGRDVWRISRALGAAPWTFLLYFGSPQPMPDSFILDKSGRHYRLALAKGASKRKKLPPPCMFLIKTRDGHHRCGLGELRPQACRTFPLRSAAGMVSVMPDTGCVCRDWTLAEVDVEEEKAGLKARFDEYVEYSSLVETWNRGVMDLPDDDTVDFYQYCEFVMRSYSRAESDAESAGAQP